MYKRKEIIGDCTLFLGDNKDIIDSVECDAVVLTSSKFIYTMTLCFMLVKLQIWKLV